MSAIALPVCLLLAYLAGSIPFGLILARLLKGVDLRAVGSGNIGATNASRALGTKWGLVVLVLDALKGWLPAALLPGCWSKEPADLALLTAGAGIAAILGHMYSVWLGFQGGKGVATALGVLLAVSPYGTLTAFIVFATAFAATRIVSLGSILAATSFAIHQLIALQPQPFSAVLWPIATFSLVAPALVIAKHRANIQRLLQGTEPRFGRSRPASPTVP